jgi:hypothetical protein
MGAPIDNHLMIHFRVYDKRSATEKWWTEELTISFELNQLHIPSGCEHVLEDAPGLWILQFGNIRLGNFFKVLYHWRTAGVNADKEFRAGVHDEMSK